MIARALAVLLLAALALAGVQTWRLHRAQLAVGAAKLKMAQNAAQAATALAAAQSDAREQERKHVEDARAAAAQYQQDVALVAHKAQVVIDDLRAGNLRLRDQWQGCQADRVPATGSSAAGVDAAAELRKASAGHLVQAAAACDAQVKALQDVLRRERE